MKKYVWCEDSKSGYQFWKEIFGAIHPEFIVESKGNNTRLRKAVSCIEDDGNTYFVLMDTAKDNPDVLRENIALQKAVKEKCNVQVIKIHSFEFALLSFELLEQWVFDEQDELREKRRKILDGRKIFVKLFDETGDVEDLSSLKQLLEYYKDHNTEQIASKLLFDITCNTGFETNKSKLGPCFIVNCCDWKEKQSDDICGLNNNPINADQKKQQLVEYSVLKKAFMEAGL